MQWDGLLCPCECYLLLALRASNLSLKHTRISTKSFSSKAQNLNFCAPFFCTFCIVHRNLTCKGLYCVPAVMSIALITLIVASLPAVVVRGGITDYEFCNHCYYYIQQVYEHRYLKLKDKESGENRLEVKW